MAASFELLGEVGCVVGHKRPSMLAVGDVDAFGPEDELLALLTEPGLKIQRGTHRGATLGADTDGQGDAQLLQAKPIHAHLRGVAVNMALAKMAAGLAERHNGLLMLLTSTTRSDICLYYSRRKAALPVNYFS